MAVSRIKLPRVPNWVCVWGGGGGMIVLDILVRRKI